MLKKISITLFFSLEKFFIYCMNNRQNQKKTKTKTKRVVVIISDNSYSTFNKLTAVARMNKAYYNIEHTEFFLLNIIIHFVFKNVKKKF